MKQASSLGVLIVDICGGPALTPRLELGSLCYWAYPSTATIPLQLPPLARSVLLPWYTLLPGPVTIRSSLKPSRQPVPT